MVINGLIIDYMDLFIQEVSLNMSTFCSNSELKIKPDIKVMPSTDVIEGDLITFNCSVNMTHQRNSELRIYFIHKSFMLSSNMIQEEYKIIAMANNSGKYECISKLGDVQKPSSVYITVKGERY